MKKYLSLFLALILTLSLVACAGEKAGEESSEAAPVESAAESSAEESSEAEEEAAADDEKWATGLKAGVAACHATNAWNTTNTEDIVAALEAVGFEVYWNEGKNDTATQVANIEDLIAKGIDLLVTKPKEEEGLIPAFKACQEAGIPVICADRKVSDDSLYVTALMSDNVAGGEAIGQWIADNFADGAKVIEIVGTPGSTAQLERSQGMYNILDQHDNIEVLDSQVGNNMRTDAQKVTENMVQAYGKDGIDVIVTQSDEMVMGILQALDGLGIVPGEDITVCTIGDGNKECVTNVASGRISAAYEVTPYLGAQVAEVAKQIFVDGVTEMDKFIPCENRLFTIENAETELPNITW